MQLILTADVVNALGCDLFNKAYLYALSDKYGVDCSKQDIEAAVMLYLAASSSCNLSTNLKCLAIEASAKTSLIPCTSTIINTITCNLTVTQAAAATPCTSLKINKI